jgi:hypothetical protein
MVLELSLHDISWKARGRRCWRSRRGLNGFSSEVVPLDMLTAILMFASTSIEGTISGIHRVNALKVVFKLIPISVSIDDCIASVHSESTTKLAFEK